VNSRMLSGGLSGIVLLMIELATVIAALRDELDSARVQGAGEYLRFELGPIELEVSVAVEKTGGVDAKVNFWVVELGADGKLGSTSTQRIKLTLQPHLTVAAAQPPLSPDRPYVSGKKVERER
jgi:hypothetical protein